MKKNKIDLEKIAIIILLILLAAFVLFLIILMTRCAFSIGGWCSS